MNMYIYIYILVDLERGTQNESSGAWVSFFKTWIQNVVDCVDQMKYSAPERNQNVISKRKSG